MQSKNKFVMNQKFIMISSLFLVSLMLNIVDGGKSGFKDILLGDQKPRQRICDVQPPKTNTNSGNSTLTGNNSTSTAPPPAGFITQTTPQPSSQQLTYVCPRPNEYEKKTYCCSENRCCEKKEYEWEQKQQSRRAAQDFLSKNNLGGILKGILITILIVVIVVAVLICLCIKALCSKGKMLSGIVLNRPSSTAQHQPMGSYPIPGEQPPNYQSQGYPPPAGGYVPPPGPAWQPQPQPAYPPYNPAGASYPMPSSQPSAPPASAGFQSQPMYNPNFS